jgi:hypothetical protein
MSINRISLLTFIPVIADITASLIVNDIPEEYDAVFQISTLLYSFNKLNFYSGLNIVM